MHPKLLLHSAHTCSRSPVSLSFTFSSLPDCSQTLKCPSCLPPRSQGLGNPRASLGQVGDATWAESRGEAFSCGWFLVLQEARGMRTVCNRDTYWLLGAQGLGEPGPLPGEPGGHACGRVSCLFSPSGQVGLVFERTWEDSSLSLVLLRIKVKEKGQLLLQSISPFVWLLPAWLGFQEGEGQSHL